MGIVQRMSVVARSRDRILDFVDRYWKEMYQSIKDLQQRIKQQKDPDSTAAPLGIVQRISVVSRSRDRILDFVDQYTKEIYQSIKDSQQRWNVVPAVKHLTMIASHHQDAAAD
jgi:hypothetical protein